MEHPDSDWDEMGDSQVEVFRIDYSCGMRVEWPPKDGYDTYVQRISQADTFHMIMCHLPDKCDGTKIVQITWVVDDWKFQGKRGS